ncbi:RelA/SpoT domain-containing protein [Clostridium senegalense]|uniref:RelA/SpoT domain-containing protein n=1 Tax=Clostridium senegalense TaxID=1465809 RepID=UPI001C0FA7D9|nr:RelA/SpoT domain-containing protein [Clostridium senegalense]MBU5225921.1 RelA/SpoT domain-containing protein [Clostridium senegalense]
MKNNIDKKVFFEKYPFTVQEIEKNNINWDNLNAIYNDFIQSRENYETQAEFISNIVKNACNVHTVKARVKNAERLIEKIIRKTRDRKEKYGEDFNFTIENYKDEINDLIGIRAIHIFKQEWESIHQFILNTWKVTEMTANVREGDDTSRFEELGIQIHSRKSGYRSVHYLIEFYPTSQKVIAEIQVRTIFEEGYGEIDHQLRYSHKEIPKVLEANLLLFNRIAGSADEMASFINLLNDNLGSVKCEYNKVLKEKEEEIKLLKEKICSFEKK